MSNSSLPYGYENIGEALGDPDGERAQHSFQFRDGSAPLGPRGVFYDRHGDAMLWPFRRPSAEAPNPGNQNGWLLNAYGERGNRTIWLTYTTGVRQSH